MATIKSGYGVEYLQVDPNKAARAALYDSAGNPRHPTYSGGYQCRIDVVPASMLTDGTCYWAIRNTGSAQVYIRSINLIVSYVGAGANSRSLLRFERFNTGNPTGGTSIPIVKRDNAFPNSTVSYCLTGNSGLSTTAVVWEANGPIVFGMVNQPMSMPVTFDYSSGGEEGRFSLAAGEGLALRAHGTIVAGCAVQGTIWWDER